MRHECRLAGRARGWAVAVVLTGGMTAAAGQEPALDLVLERAGAYVADYEERFSLLVAEEHYTQRIQPGTSASAAFGGLSRSNPGGGTFGSPPVGEVRRELRSDYLLVQLQSGGGWMPFRDVFEVDGAPIRDRGDRLLELFVNPPAGGGLKEADRIMAESTRYNVGPVVRTINIPTLAVLFAHPDLQPRFSFKQTGTEAIDGRTARVIDYRERRRPTLVKTTRGRDMPLAGTLWIDPETGTILKTHMVAANGAVRATIDVTFRHETGLDLWVPAQMDEVYRGRGLRTVYGEAAYANYRRFRVETDEVLRKPPG